MPSALFEKLNEDLKIAMKQRDAFRLSVLRMMKAKLMTVDPRGNIPDPDATKLLTKYAKTLKESIDIAKQAGRHDVEERTHQELVIVESYLPEQLGEDEVKQLVAEAITRVGATSRKQMGLVMKEIMGKAQGVDGALVKKLVEAELS